jgi:ATP-dependent Clp protease ATP-binding subunit ClpC
MKVQDEAAERGFFDLEIPEKRAKLKGLEGYLKEHLFGQDEALSVIARGYRCGLHGVEDDPKPMGTFLFLGPTGTGKSESIKRQCEWMWGRMEGDKWKPGSRKRCIIFAMGDLGHEDSVATFLGRPGAEEGQLHRVWKQATKMGKGTTIVFDEADKSHKFIKSVFLNMLEEGVVTTANGTEMSFRDFFIVATTNFGAGAVSQVSTDNEALLRDMMLKAAKDEEKGFRPEGVARFGSVVYFRALSKATLNRIVGVECDRLGGNLRTSWIPAVYPELECKDVVLDEDAVNQIRKLLDNDAGGARFARTCVKDVLANVGLDYIHGHHTILGVRPFALRFTSVDSEFVANHEFL